ncbi:MAG TPA: hypothetical protein DDZ76_12450 [Xanthomonadales bacterium]|nr:hypothetical protein [Xanthomonadales bacterium]
MSRHNMSRQKLLAVSGVVALLLLLTALWLSDRYRSGDGSHVGEPLLPDLAQRIDDLDRISIIGPGQKELVGLTRSEAGWTVSQRNGWPADVKRLREWLSKLAKASRLEAKTALASNYGQLGVADIDAEPAADSNSEGSTERSGTGVRVDIAAGERLDSLLIGQNNPNGSGSYVRIPGDAQSWLADTDLAVELDPSRWLARALLSIPESDLVSVRIERASGTLTAFERSGDSTESGWVLTSAPKGEVGNETALLSAAGFLDGLRLDDVEQIEPPDEAPDMVAEFVRRDGLRATVSFWPDQISIADPAIMPWAGFTFEFDEARATAFHDQEYQRDLRAIERRKSRTQAPADAADDGGSESEPADGASTEGASADSESTGAPGAGEGGSDAPPADASANAAEELPESVADRVARSRAEVEALREKTRGWQFRLPAFKVGNLRRDPGDFTSDRPG